MISCALFLNNKYQVQQLADRLEPGSDPMPDGRCSDPPKDSIVIFLGSDAFQVRTFPHDIVRVDTKPVLSVDRTKDGHIVPLLDIKMNRKRL